jgi:hypothetical protein
LALTTRSLGERSRQRHHRVAFLWAIALFHGTALEWLNLPYSRFAQDDTE